MSVLVGLDIGTTGARALAITPEGQVIAQATASYPLLLPRPGWAEQHPADWWEAAKTVLRAVAQMVGDRIVGLGLTGQMHGAVFLDEHDEVIRPALLWNDQRTAAQCVEIEQRVGSQQLREIAGNPALTGFQAPKILWVREHEPENYRRIRHVLLPKDYIRLQLTGTFATDASDAAGTLLLDLRRRDWSPTILEALAIPREWLPQVYEGPMVTGYVRAAIAAELGLPAGIVVAAGGGDNAAAAVGTGIITPGRMSASIGTSGVLFVHSDELVLDPTGRVHVFCHAVPGAYHLMAVTLSAGGSLRWWRDVLTATDYTVLADEAAAVSPGAEGLLFLPYLTGERTPHRDPLARGAFIGLTARHGRAHLTRAVMEGVVFSLRDGLECLRDCGVEVREVRVTGGGARHPLWLQLLADIFNQPIYRTAIDEGPAYGAALLAGVAAGVYRDLTDASQYIRVEPTIVYPDPLRVARYNDIYQLYCHLYPALRDIFWQLSASDSLN